MVRTHLPEIEIVVEEGHLLESPDGHLHDLRVHSHHPPERLAARLWHPDDQHLGELRPLVGHLGSAAAVAQGFARL